MDESEPLIYTEGMIPSLDRMYKPCKYRLYPFHNQRMELLRQFGELCYLWNYALGERMDAWQIEHRSVSYKEQQRSLTRWRAYCPELGCIHSQVAQNDLRRLDSAFRVFFQHRARYPRFKHEVTSLTYPQATNGSATIVPGRNGTQRLHLAKIGGLPIEMHHAPPSGRLKTCTVEREGDRWFAILTFEVPDPAPPPSTSPESPVGVDLGLTTLATLSTGEKVEPPKFLRKAEKRLKIAQHNLSHKVKGSENWHKQKVRVQRCYAKVRDSRRDFAHKLTTGWAETYDLIAFEDMDLRGLTRTRMAKSILDAGWGMLRQMSEYKQRNRSQRYAEVSTKGTTQTCSGCGRLHEPPLTLKDRTYDCPCGLHLDRDLNAARNVLNRALAIVPGGTGESTPVETGPPPHRKGRRVRSPKQEPPCAMGPAT